jgi:hypothetical protein
MMAKRGDRIKISSIKQLPGIAAVFEILKKPHNTLINKSGLYKRWHENPYHHKIHWTLASVNLLVAAILVFSSLTIEPLRAANYLKTWTTTSDFNSGTNSNIDTSSDQAQLAKTNTNFNEGFTGTAYDDTVNTTATWDTTGHKLNLPGDPSSGVATDLQAKWKATVGVTENITSTTYDSTNHYIYLGGSLGSFAAFNPASGIVVNLTPKISAVWPSTYAVSSLAFDSINGYIYLGGAASGNSDPYRFGAFAGGSNPANGTWIDLKSKVSTDFAVNSATYINALTFDATNGYVYISGGFGHFGAFIGGVTPTNGTYSSLTSKISSDWSTYLVDSLTYDSTNHIVYLGGDSGKFGSFAGGATPSSGTWTYLTAKISADWSNSSVYSLTFDSTNGFVYLAGDTGRFGAFLGGSSPSSGTWTLLNSKISANWSIYNVNSLTFDSTNNTIYLGGQGGKFGAFIGGATPSSGTWTYLTAKISADWSTTTISPLVFDSTNSVIYLAGISSGKFGKFAGGATPSNGTWTYLASNIAGGLVGYDIISSAYDSTNGFMYLGGATSTFMAYKLSDGTAINLTSKVSGYYGVNAIQAMCFDSTNGFIYIGGYNSRIGAFPVSATPGSNSYIDLNGYINFGSSVRSLGYDSTHSRIYIGSGDTWPSLATFTGGATPASNGVKAAAGSHSDWSTCQIISFAYDAVNQRMYLGISNGNFGYYSVAAASANDVWTSYTGIINPNWSSYAVNSITIDTTNGIVYIGGANAKFGAITTAGTWTYLNSKISAVFSTNAVNSVTYLGGKVFVGGAGGNFGVVTALADPSNDVWTNLATNVSSINGANQINTILAYGTVTLYISSATGAFLSFQIGYVTNKNSFSLKLNSTSQTINSATLTATDSKPTNTAITYYLSNNGGSTWNAVTSGSPYTFSTATSDLRWKANLTTTDASVTPSVTGVAINYNYLNSNSGTMDLAYDATQAVTPTLLSWNDTLPANTAMTFKIRTASTSNGLSSATWSDIKNASDTPVNLQTLNVGGITGVPENQFSEINISFSTTDGLNSPVLSDVSEQYVINAAPELQSVTASQSTDGSKIVNIGFQLKDSDSHLNPVHQDQVNIAYKYSVDGGTSWQNCLTTTGGGLLTVNSNNTWKSFSATWNAGIDLANQVHTGTVKLKVLANDDELAHNTTEQSSSAFSIDTKNPVLGAIGSSTGVKIGDGTSWTNNPRPDLSLLASDDSAKFMEIRNDTAFTGTTVPYATSVSGYQLSSGDGNKTVYVRFYDAFGNTADASASVLLDTTPPNQPVNLKIYDTSEKSLSRYSLTLIWDSVAAVDDFNNYKIERKVNSDGNWNILTTSLNPTYSDVGLDKTKVYYYRVTATDIHTNASTASSEVHFQPDSADTSAPEISGPVPESDPQDVKATISWITNEASDSFVEYGTSTAYGNSQGKVEMVTGHSVELVGLSASTQYYYRVNSTDAAGNKMTGPDQTFTTTLPKEASSSPTITGATAQKPGANPEEVTIIWTTDKYSSSQVLYGETTDLESQTTEDTTLNKTHYISINKLKPNTKYYYKVKSVDTYNNTVLGDLKYFVTAKSDGEDQKPAIASVEVSNITLDSAIISWETSVVTTSVIEYGVDETYGSKIEDISLGSTTKHVVRLKNLSQGTKFHYRVLGDSADGSTLAANVDSTFSTLAMPVISDLSANNIGSTSAIISWKTSSAADSYVDFGAEATSQSQGQSDLVSDHSVTLIGLKPATKYLFRAKSRDQYTNQATSDIQSFSTIIDTTPPVIKDMKSEVSIITNADGASKAQAVVSWSTDEPATSQIRYAMGVAIGSEYPLSTTEDTNLTTSHVMIISDLQPSATYHLKLLSKDSSNNLATSDDYTVLTLNQDKSLLQYIIQILEDRFSWLKGFGLF